MTAFLFAYRMPADYRPGQAATMAAWAAWFEGMGAHVTDTGRPVYESSTLGDCAADTRLGGYSLIEAASTEEAVALARQCPALREGGGVEIGVLASLPPAAPETPAAGRPAASEPSR